MVLCVCVCQEWSMYMYKYIYTQFLDYAKMKDINQLDIFSKTLNSTRSFDE